jgi:Na+-transporting NADH:ubiquinone oxidoreductase subunit NqrB
LITHVCKPSIDAILCEALLRFPRAGPAMTAWFGWALAVAAVAVGYVGYGWRGVALAFTVTAFWLLLQFSRALRTLRLAASQPVGHVANAVMLQAQLQRGMRLPQVLQITRSLGRRVADEPETWAWADEAGDEVQVVLEGGRVTRWELKRAGA